MKQYIKYALFSMALAGTMTSCDMDAPEKSALDASRIFSQYSLAESEVMSIHVSFGETNSYRGRFLPYYGINTDVEVSSGTAPSASSGAADARLQLANYATPYDNTQMNTSIMPTPSSTRVLSVPTWPSRVYANMATLRTIPSWHSCWARPSRCVP